MPKRKRSFYERYVKRYLDIICALAVLVCFGWLYIVIAILVRIKLGKPVLFKQPRPGQIDPHTKKEVIFDLYKFRTMTDEKDKDGNLLPDNQRLTKFGKLLRASSMDELPEVIFNILKGDMSLIGPRPQLVRDMVFMSKKQRQRHLVKPGLSGLAQVMGRNAISWEEKLDWDLKYIEKISFLGDMKILWLTVKNVFGRKESDEELSVTDDYGDVLLKGRKVESAEYNSRQKLAKKLIALHETSKSTRMNANKRKNHT